MIFGEWGNGGDMGVGNAKGRAIIEKKRSTISEKRVREGLKGVRGLWSAACLCVGLWLWCMWSPFPFPFLFNNFVNEFKPQPHHFPSDPSDFSNLIAHIFPYLLSHHLLYSSHFPYYFKPINIHFFPLKPVSSQVMYSRSKKKKKTSRNTARSIIAECLVSRHIFFVH